MTDAHINELLRIALKALLDASPFIAVLSGWLLRKYGRSILTALTSREATKRQTGEQEVVGQQIALRATVLGLEGIDRAVEYIEVHLKDTDERVEALQKQVTSQERAHSELRQQVIGRLDEIDIVQGETVAALATLAGKLPP